MLLVLAGYACLVLSACGKKEVSIAGKWRFNISGLPNGSTPVEITFREDHTFVGISAGTWSISGDTVTVKPTTIGQIRVDSLNKMSETHSGNSAPTDIFGMMRLRLDSTGRYLLPITNGGATTSTPIFIRQ